MIRFAIRRDESALRRLDREVWSTLHNPGPIREGRFDITGTLVYDVEDELAGYVQLGPWSKFPSAGHVRQVRGIAVAERFRGRGIARALIEAAVGQAELQGARKLTLQVLAHNAPARALYEACGFVQEGTLTGVFYLDGEYVDDVFMSLDLPASR